MWRFGLWQAGRLALGLLGAILLAAVVASLPDSAVLKASSFASSLLSHLGAMLRLDFGTSLLTGTPAASVLGERLPATLELVGAGALIALLAGLPLGLLLGSSRILRAASPLIQIVAAAPVFCASLALLWAAANVLGWREFTALGALRPLEPSTDGSAAAIHALRELALPAIAVGAAGAASVQLALRRALAQALEEPYRRGLSLMGVPTLEISRIYVAPQVLGAVLGRLGEIVQSLIAAAAVAEWVFNWPGAAVLFLKSAALGDWSVAALVLLAFASLAFVAEFLGVLAARVLGVTEETA
jgi:peptide/nickel transport system permease protein